MGRVVRCMHRAARNHIGIKQWYMPAPPTHLITQKGGPISAAAEIGFLLLACEGQTIIFIFQLAGSRPFFFFFFFLIKKKKKKNIDIGERGCVGYFLKLQFCFFSSFFFFFFFFLQRAMIHS